jgi:hypothetical protein
MMILNSMNSACVSLHQSCQESQAEVAYQFLVWSEVSGRGKPRSQKKKRKRAATQTLIGGGWHIYGHGDIQ